MDKPKNIAAPKGKLGILLPGMGAVATTFMAGVELVRKKKAQPVGSLTQMGTIRLGRREDGWPFAQGQGVRAACRVE